MFIYVDTPIWRVVLGSLLKRVYICVYVSELFMESLFTLFTVNVF